MLSVACGMNINTWGDVNMWAQYRAYNIVNSTTWNKLKLTPTNRPISSPTNNVLKNTTIHTICNKLNDSHYTLIEQPVSNVYHYCGFQVVGATKPSILECVALNYISDMAACVRSATAKDMI